MLNPVLLLILFVASLTSCTVAQPSKPDNICHIFHQYPHWYWQAQRVEKKWGTPIPVQMAILHQESKFSAKAKPPRKKLLGFIPWTRPSSAYGYSQALNKTWRYYQTKTGNGQASRDNFNDALEFVGWYTHQTTKKLKIPKSDTRAHYLAYHEGQGGYQRKTHLKKAWLQRVASKVARRADTYQAQLSRCQKKLPKKPWYRFW